MEGKISGTKKIRGFLGILFSRLAVIIILLLIQAAVLIIAFERLREHFSLIYGIFTVLGVLVVIYIINAPGSPEFKIAWVLPILIIPIFGTGYYIYSRLEARTKILRQSLDEQHFKVSGYMQQDPEVAAELRRANPSLSKLAYYMSHELGYPIHRNTQVVYYEIGEKMFEAMMQELRKAEKYIFMEYFIISRGEMWTEVLTLLREKVKEGVEVRFMYDGMNIISQVSHDYPKVLESYGIKVKVFSPLKPVFATYQNNRDHRKICVIDGETGFTGGINLADEYINRKERFGHWKDTGVMLKGDAVQNLTMMFLEMWNAGQKGSEYHRNYLTPDYLKPDENKAFVLPFGDSPFSKNNAGQQVYFYMLDHARKFVHIMTPYLVLDNDMIRHMTYAARSGIEVIIIMPHIPDKWTAFALAKTYYEELISAGVQIYEYTPGFVHAKVYVSDYDTAVVGTINCDFRSLYLHFENAVMFYRSQAVRQVELDFQRTLEKCQRISIVECRRTPFRMKITGKIMRVFAPLM